MIDEFVTIKYLSTLLKFEGTCYWLSYCHDVSLVIYNFYVYSFVVDSMVFLKPQIYVRKLVLCKELRFIERLRIDIMPGRDC